MRRLNRVEWLVVVDVALAVLITVLHKAPANPAFKPATKAVQIT